MRIRKKSSSRDADGSLEETEPRCKELQVGQKKMKIPLKTGRPE